MFNPWKHIRLVGAVVVIGATLFASVEQRLTLVMIGLLLQYLGVVGAIDRVEKLIDIIVDKENTDEPTES